MEELKARILEIVEDYEEGISVLDNDMAQAGIDPKSDFVNTIEQLLEERECRAREEGREELLNSIVVGIEQLRSIVMMFNPISAEIRAKQSGEVEAYNGLLEKLSKLNKKK